MNKILNYRKVKLGEILEALTDYHANGSYKKLKENVELLDKPNYAVMIRTTNFEKDDFSDDLKYITQDAYEYLEKSKVKPGDILMNKIGEAGNVYYMPDLNRPVSLAMNLFLLRVSNKVNQRYVYYYLKAHEDYVKGFSNGTTTKTITKKAVRNLDIILPRLAIQNKISSVLASFEKLIENNNRRIEILEEMARRIYREWFVHFHYPGYENDELVESDTRFGDIPKGWPINDLNDFVSFQRGVEPGADNYKEEPDDGTVPFLRVGDFSKRPSDIYINEDLAKGRLLMRKSIAVTLDGTVGIVQIGNQGAYSSGIQRVDIEDDLITWAFTYCLMRSDNIQNTIHKHASGSTILHASSSKKHMKLVLPPEELIQLFEKKVAPILDLKIILEKKNKKLKEARDLLLPKLISGKVDVEEITVN